MWQSLTCQIRPGSRAHFIHSKMHEFIEFIGDLGLVDLPTFENKFTCFGLAGDSVRRLYHFFYFNQAN